MKITFVLLIATGRDINNTINILLPSIQKFFDLDNIETFYIIIKDNDFDLFNQYAFKNNIDLNKFKIEIIKDSELIDFTTDNTYYLQMYLKLFVHRIIKTKYYLTLDSDLYFCKKSSTLSFVKDKAFYQKKNFVDKWTERVNENLNINTNFTTNQTPFILVKQLVKDMFENINVKDLIINKLCSEYTLYIGYLNKNNLINSYYTENNFCCKPINYNSCKNLMIDNDILLGESFILNENEVIGCIQSRTNQHYKLIDTLKIYLDNCNYKKFKIAILTVVTNDNYYKKYKEAIYIKSKYCKYNNYKFEFFILNEKSFDLKKGWLKIYKLKQIIKNYDYVFMSDADVVITNNDIRLEDIILRYENNNFMFITTDYNSLNSGNIIWKNCEDTINFIDKLLEIKDDKIRLTLNQPFKVIGIYEQPTIIYLINKYEEYRNKIKIIPQFVMNSYSEFIPTSSLPNIIQHINDTDNRCKWKPNDFLVHFAGYNYNLNTININFEKLIKNYCIIYKLNIIKKEGIDYGTIR